MKKKLIIIIAGIATMFACNNHEKELADLNHQRDSLMSQINVRDSSINDFISSFNAIENNLDDITKKQNIISMNVDKKGGELKESSKEKINSEIKSINDLIDKNKGQIAELNKRLKNSNIKSSGFEKMIKTLNEQIVQKDNELAELNSKLTTLNTQVAQLQTTVDTLGSLTSKQTQTISDQTTAMHTAYYIVGSSKQLQASKVINRTGGVLGIGKTSTLNDRVDNSKFTKIDYTQTLNIPVNSEAKIVTTHPSDSYKLEKDTKNKNKIVDLKITNPDKFWSTSKYLVVVKD
jgi:septal ring factor EnvC (AmiA/AmiB activator)